MSLVLVPEPDVEGPVPVRPGPRPVVVGIDASGTSVVALSWACAEARRSGQALHVLHAHGVDLLEGTVDVLADQVDLETLTRRAEATLAAAVDRARAIVPGTRVTGSVVLGPTVEVLLEHSGGAALLVLGSHGRGALARVLQGSVAQRVAAHARCPVVVLPPAVGVPEPALRRVQGHRDQRIVAGIDGHGPDAAAVLGFAFEQSAARGAFLEVVTTWRYHRDPLSPVREGPAEVERRLISRSALLLAKAITPWAARYPHVHVRHNAVEGPAIATLVRRGLGAELLVVGSRGRSGVAGFLLGSVSGAVVQHAVCPVAVVRPRP